MITPPRFAAKFLFYDLQNAPSVAGMEEAERRFTKGWFFNYEPDDLFVGSISHVVNSHESVEYVFIDTTPRLQQYKQVLANGKSLAEQLNAGEPVDNEILDWMSKHFADGAISLSYDPHQPYEKQFALVFGQEKPKNLMTKLDLRRLNIKV